MKLNNKANSRIPLVSIVILNWNGLKLTKECLNSLNKLTYKNVEILVVDNGSTDGSKKWLKTQKNIQFVNLPENTGFTGGHIEGLNVAKGDYIVLLNNDTVVASDWVEQCLNTFHRHKDAAVVGGKSYFWNNNNLKYDENNEFYSYQEVDATNGYTRTLLTGDSELSVDAISGAALMCRKSIIEKVGYLDNDFFAYYEETDLIARFIRSGFKAYYNPNAKIWHKVAASTKDGENSLFYLKQMHRNRYFFAYKNFDAHNLKLFLSSYKKEVHKARIKRFLLLKNNTELKARILAQKEVTSIKKKLVLKRKETLKLGKTYNSLLNSHTPKDVTIIITCFNYGSYVSEAIESSLKQSLPPKKIIVINDGSTDNTKKVLKNYENNPIIQVINKNNEGLIKTKNLALKLSNTYWTMFLDADDKLDKDALFMMLGSVEREGRADVIYSDMLLFGSISDYFKARDFQAHSFIMKNYVNNSSLINTTMLKRSGGYKLEMSGGLEDWELYVSLLEIGAVFKYIALPLVLYRQHEQTTKSRNSAVQEESEGKNLFKTIKLLHPELYKKHRKGRRRFIKFCGIIVGILLHPSTIIVIVNSIPIASKQAIGYIYTRVNQHLNKV